MTSNLKGNGRECIWEFFFFFPHSCKMSTQFPADTYRGSVDPQGETNLSRRLLDATGLGHITSDGFTKWPWHLSEDRINTRGYTACRRKSNTIKHKRAILGWLMPSSSSLHDQTKGHTVQPGELAHLLHLSSQFSFLFFSFYWALVKTQHAVIWRALLWCFLNLPACTAAEINRREFCW